MTFAASLPGCTSVTAQPHRIEGMASNTNLTMRTPPMKHHLTDLSPKHLPIAKLNWSTMVVQSTQRVACPAYDLPTLHSVENPLPTLAA
jgi:hypothetical protein